VIRGEIACYLQTNFQFHSCHALKNISIW